MPQAHPDSDEPTEYILETKGARPQFIEAGKAITIDGLPVPAGVYRLEEVTRAVWLMPLEAPVTKPAAPAANVITTFPQKAHGQS